jgi:hypothetical protein
MSEEGTFDTRSLQSRDNMCMVIERWGDAEIEREMHMESSPSSPVRIPV